MADRRDRLQKSANARVDASPRRSTRRGKATLNDEGVKDVYWDLLSEATSSKAAGLDEDGKPLKKRRVAATRSSREPDIIAEPSRKSPPLEESPLQPQEHLQAASRATVDEENDVQRAPQTIELSEESDDSDLEWEDALADDVDEEDEAAEGDVAFPTGDISITIEANGLEEREQTKRVKRRGITAADRKRRLDIHKMHILCLLYHVHRRNAWCNDEKVQAALRKIPSPKMLSNLVPNPEFTQFQASKRFIDGMQDLNMLWSKRFSVTALGMHKPRWRDLDEMPDLGAFEDLDDPMDKEDFRRAASRLNGSQDLGAQLFCALLRGIGVEARLVCSLQCLPFAVAAQSSTPSRKESKNVIHLDPYNQSSNSTSSVPAAAPRRKPMSRLERVLGERTSKLSSGVAPKQQKKYHTAYPVYWVEVFNQALQKWIPIDPLSTGTVNKADKLEPPLNYSQNTLSYAVAFEEDHTAKDVTRRYAKAYNAKTRKFRVESAEGGAKWWKSALRPFKRRVPLDRDQVEDAALARKEASEGMPKNVQDFKSHPVYVLERHLRHNEVIHPMHQVGKVNVGSAMNPTMESIYRRKDVHIVRSADKWYRLGRDVKAGEQPLKHAKPKRGARARSVHLETEMDVDDVNDEIGVGLYAVFQTELYVPPPVVSGRVPRNAFGNLDLYVPSMVPPGGAHVRHKLAAKVARIVGVDSADAVTGFSFKGRQGTAIIEGVVVAEEYKDAVEAVIEGMEYAQEESEFAQRSEEALRMWRRFLVGLQIAQRVNAIEIDGEVGPSVDVQEEIEREEKRITEQQLAGGFFVDEGTVIEPTSHHNGRSVYQPGDGNSGGGFIPDQSSDGRESLQESSHRGQATDPYAGGGGFIPEADANGGGFILQDANQGGGSLTADSKQGGGFVPEDAGQGGGFLREDAHHGSALTTEPSDLLQERNQQVEIPIHQPYPDTGQPDNQGVSLSQVDERPEDTGANAASAEEKAVKSPPADIKRPTQAKNNHDGVTQDPDNVTAALNEQRVGQASDAVPAKAKANVGSKPIPKSAVLPPASSPSDAGSLPLEDPEDEDADPDWLVDVT